MIVRGVGARAAQLEGNGLASSIKKKERQVAQAFRPAAHPFTSLKQTFQGTAILDDVYDWNQEVADVCARLAAIW